MKQKRHWKDLYNPSAFADRYCKTGMMLACFSQWALIDFLSSSPRPALRRNLRACFFTFCKFFVLIAARATPNLSCARVVDIKSPALKDIKFPMLHMFISSEGLYIHSLQYLVSWREQQKTKHQHESIDVKKQNILNLKSNTVSDSAVSLWDQLHLYISVFLTCQCIWLPSLAWVHCMLK